MIDWSGKWSIIKNLPSGGQGDAFIVVGKESDSQQYFLKVLKSTTDSQERRSRLHREISCYETLSHPRIPKLVDSNNLLFIDQSVTPFVVTEFIPGETLYHYVSKQKSGFLTVKEAFDLTFALLDIVEYLFQQDTVHRDIKPDNIILRNSNPSDPVLVDFGLAYFESEEIITGNGQQLGNRFLRLSDFSPGSSDKRSPKSDVTLCSGILFYALTGKMPRELRDENGHAPHQSPSGRKALLKHSDIDLLGLMNVFDRSFELKLHTRWETATSLSKALSKIRIGHIIMENEHTVDDYISIIRIQMESHEEKRLSNINLDLEKVDKLLRININSLEKELNGIGSTSGGNHTDISQQTRTGMIGLVKISDNSKGYRPTYQIEVQGDEIVLTLNETIIFREQRFDLDRKFDELSKLVRTNLLLGLSEELSLP